MSDPRVTSGPADGPAAPATPTLQRLCAELIALRERNDRQHKVFEQAQAQLRDELQSRFDHFAADVQQAYQRLRDELTGEKRLSLALLTTLVDVTLDLHKLIDAMPAFDGVASAWADGVAVARVEPRLHWA